MLRVYLDNNASTPVLPEVFEAMRPYYLERFGNADLADQWLARPNPSLDNRTPRDAAAEIELFIRALGLLHGPRAVAAA
jgi:hypothetical protein